MVKGPSIRTWTEDSPPGGDVSTPVTTLRPTPRRYRRDRTSPRAQRAGPRGWPRARTVKHRHPNWREEMDTSAATIAQDRQSVGQADLKALKARQQATWSSGDYAVIGTTLQIVGEELCEALDVRAGQRVLDVAAGNGNATLAAARRWCQVTSTDYVPSLLECGRARASAEGLKVAFKVADAEALPFDDGAFDAVVSTFGVMFTPNQDRAASELLRVCRPGGQIGLANWTPDGFIGQMFKILGKYLPPPAGVKSPALWGTRARLDEMFQPGATTIRTEPRYFK